MLLSRSREDRYRIEGRSERAIGQCPQGRLAPQELTCGADRAVRLTLMIVIIVINVHTRNI